MYRLWIHTGPTNVKLMSRMVKRAGIRVASTGTEHLHVDVPGSDCYTAEQNFYQALHRKHLPNNSRKRVLKALRVRSCTRRPR